ncbi:MAG: tRNA threonylcarbamoyladenosine dehydratase [Firmicutes bacterium]|nr:tRNA threonylcarbamoyladenosine dehydratase [Candidatus Caballimonas caccae]
MENFSRVSLMIGEEKLNKLKNSSVIVFGVGGVGGYTVESLVRSGVGRIAVVDNDTVSESNLNRQIIATIDSIGKSKVDVIEKRSKEINPEIIFEKYNLFYLPETADKIDLKSFDYVVDAVDTVKAKLEIIERAKRENVKVISSMGTAGKLNPLSLKVCDIKETNYCPLARVMRRELKKRNIESLKVVFSTEKQNTEEIIEESGKRTPPSMIFVPATCGIIIANEIVKDLIK